MTTQPAVVIVFHCALNWRTTSEPKSPSPAERVTIRPDATESNSAGICDTSPSPTLNSEYLVIDSPRVKPF